MKKRLGDLSIGKFPHRAFGHLVLSTQNLYCRPADLASPATRQAGEEGISHLKGSRSMPKQPPRSRFSGWRDHPGAGQTPASADATWYGQWIRRVHRPKSSDNLTNRPTMLLHLDGASFWAEWFNARRRSDVE